MPTNNCINTQNPITVANGGLGTSSLTDGGVLIGSGTNPVTALSVGAASTVLQGVTASDPTFTATPSVTSITLSSTDALSSYVEAVDVTPTLSFGGGSVGITYATQIARYCRVGDLVVLTINIVLTNKGSSTGNMNIAGAWPAQAQNFMCQGYWSNLTYAGQLEPTFFGFGGFGVGFRSTVSGGGGDPLLTDTAFANNSEVYLCGMYRTS